MNQEEKRDGLERRAFLKALGLVAAGTAAAPMLKGTAEARETPAERVKARYQESGEVRQFYALNRL